MHQTEIQFFWPLTEQIPLDLDYGPTHLHFRAKGVAGTYDMLIQGSVYDFTTVPSTLTIAAPTLKIDVQSTTIQSKTKPPLYRRWIYRLLGLKWELK